MSDIRTYGNFIAEQKAEVVRRHVGTALLRSWVAPAIETMDSVGHDRSRSCVGWKFMSVGWP